MTAGRGASPPASRVHGRRRWRAVALLLPVAAWMWLAFMLVHELGHVAGAWATGGRLVCVNVFPGQLSSTLVRPNPRPGVVLWSGLLCGWIAPAAARLATRTTGRPRRVLDCWAAFCLLAGGGYLAGGGSERLTDTGQLVAAGWPLPLLVAIGATVASLGYSWSRRAWPRLLTDLGRQPPTRRDVAAAWLLLAAWVAGQWALAAWLAEQGPAA
ncbi:MAG: hypothetical protein AAF790_02710 [Planctomycetota bacterium]